MPVRHFDSTNSEGDVARTDGPSFLIGSRGLREFAGPHAEEDCPCEELGSSLLPRERSKTQHVTIDLGGQGLLMLG
jgi:hypothetical protein